MRRATLVRFLLPFAISAILLLLVARSVAGEWDDLVAALGAADWRLLIPAVGLYFVGTWLRSMRWGLLLPAYALRTGSLFKALVIGFTVNNLLPLRMGEIARAYLLARWHQVPYGATVASLLVERVLDGLTLAMLLLSGPRHTAGQGTHAVRQLQKAAPQLEELLQHTLQKAIAP